MEFSALKTTGAHKPGNYRALFITPCLEQPTFFWIPPVLLKMTAHNPEACSDRTEQQPELAAVARLGKGLLCR